MSDAPRRTIDRVVDPSYLDNLEAMPIGELRKKKDECEVLEVEFSYARRLIQGKLDILKHGAEVLADGGSVGVTQMVEDLPGILSEGVGGAASRLPRILTPASAATQRREVERLASTTDLARLEELTAAELTELVERLTDAEKETSQRRRQVQGVMDRLTGELIRRYRDGQEDPTAILSS